MSFNSFMLDSVMNSRQFIALLFSGFLQFQIFILQVYSQEGTKWSSPDGKVVEGEFIRMEDKAVVLKLASGKEAKVPLSSLSLESHLQALQLAKPEAFSKELIKAPVIVEAATPEVVAPITSIMDFPFGEDPTIDQFLKTSVNEWKRGNNFVVWHMLPPRMQQDIVHIISHTMNTLGPAGATTFRGAFGVLGSLASKKRDWIQQSELAKIFPVQGSAEQTEKSWPIMVGMMQKLAEPELWDPANFQPDSIVGWLAHLSELMAYAREMTPELNEITYKVISQSSERAEVEVVFGTAQPQVFNFQKVGDIWVVPEVMIALRSNVDKELAEGTTLEALKTVMGIFAIMGPTLKAMDQAKTREEFDKTLAQSGLKARLGSLPSPAGSTGGAGASALPFGLPGLPMGIPGVPGIPGFSGAPTGSALP